MTQFDSNIDLKFQGVVDDALKNKQEIKILEAGCGSMSHVNFKQSKYVVGIDISEKQLVRNKYLNERVVGDIQEHLFPQESFDAIVCWDVFEHLSEPEKAIDKFINCIKRDGIIILKLPNVASVKGLVTKYTPHWFHVLWYRYVYGRKIAINEDKGPFKTYLRKSISPNRLKQFADREGLDVILFETFEGSFLKNRSMVAYSVYRIVRSITDVVSLGKLGDAEFLLVLKNRNRLS